MVPSYCLFKNEVYRGGSGGTCNIYTSFLGGLYWVVLYDCIHGMGERVGTWGSSIRSIIGKQYILARWFHRYKFGPFGKLKFLIFLDNALDFFLGVAIGRSFMKIVFTIYLIGGDVSNHCLNLLFLLA